MYRVLEGQEEYSSAYIDDVIIFSNSWVEHLQNIQMVLEELWKNGLKVKESNCQWGAKSLVYLGHEVGCGRVSVPEAKVEAIRRFVKPKTKKDLQAFLGTSGYYRRFISHYAEHSFHLTSATKKAALNTIVWTDEMCAEFVFM